MEPFDLILLFSLTFSLIAVAFSLWIHEKKVGAILKNAGLSYSDRVKIQINDPYISMLGRNWVLAAVALFLIVAMAIILRTSLISGGILIFISIILSSLLIAWLFGLRIPVLGKELKHPAVPLRRCYQECSISKRNYYKNLSGVSFVLAIFSILFASGGYVIPYYHGSSILGRYILGLHLHFLAFVFFAVCIFLLVLPMLSDWWKWRKRKIF